MVKTQEQLITTSSYGSLVVIFQGCHSSLLNSPGCLKRKTPLSTFLQASSWNTREIIFTKVTVVEQGFIVWQSGLQAAFSKCHLYKWKRKERSKEHRGHRQKDLMLALSWICMLPCSYSNKATNRTFEFIPT